jgi:excisionase family DNA binding protein
MATASRTSNVPVPTDSEAMVRRNTPVADLPAFLTAMEASVPLRCSVGLIYALVRCGELKAVRLGRLLRIPRSEIERLLAGQ